MKRIETNPLIRPADVAPSRPDFEVIGAFNAGVTTHGGDTLLLLRVAERPKVEDGWAASPIWNAEKGEMEIFRIRTNDPDAVCEDERVFHYKDDFYLTSISHLRIARSKDGIGDWRIDTAPALHPETATEAFGIEDSRITFIDGKYRILYKAVSRHGVTVSLAETADFAGYDRLGTIFCPENLDVVVFPEKIGGRYAALTRPVGKHMGAPAVWYADSPDLRDWGGHRPVFAPRPDKWDNGRVGGSCAPIRTGRGWLEIYHGATPGDRYCMGAALLDLEQPWIVTARSETPLLEPVAPYEAEGFFGNVVFPTGAVEREDGTLVIYYGAADETTCAIETSVDEILGTL